MTETNGTEPNFAEVRAWPRILHASTAPVICVAGFLCNILGSVVLIDLEMKTPISVFLTGLAISDTVTLVLYMPFAMLLLNINDKTGAKSSYAHAFMSAIAHMIMNTSAISNWLTVTVALYMLAVLQRFCDPFKGITPARARQFNYFVYISVTILCTPNYYTVSYAAKTPLRNATVWNLGISYGINTAGAGTINDINIIIHAVVMRLMPCFILTLVVFAVVKDMHRAVRFSRQLAVENVAEASKWKSNRMHTLLIARILLAVLVLFTITESSNGALMVLAHEYEYFCVIYTDLGHLLATLALMNYGTTFLLYCFMSRQFRKACKQSNCHQARQDSIFE